MFVSKSKQSKWLARLEFDLPSLQSGWILYIDRQLFSVLETKLFYCYLQSAIIGSQVEQKIVNSLEKNKTLLSFGMSFDTQGPRIRAAELMVRNNDASKL